MNVIRLAVDRPTAVLSIVLMIILMGWLALTTIPIQLTPDVRKPLIIVQTTWSGRGAGGSGTGNPQPPGGGAEGP